ncbi:MAG: mycothiol transferase [Angustibacter sp.]
MIDTSAYLSFLDDAVDGLAAILRELGDEHAGRRLDTAGANTPYAVVTHCLGVMEFWGGHVVHGRPSDRDRAAEFRAAGDVAGLLRRREAARAQLHDDFAAAALDRPPTAPPDDLEPDAAFLASTQGAVFLHVYEELAQHRGQLEVTRDVLLAHSEQG